MVTKNTGQTTVVTDQAIHASVVPANIPVALEQEPSAMQFVRDETQHTQLILINPLPADKHPAAVYLARLAPGSRRTMATALETIAALLSAGRHTAATLPWHELR